MRGGSLKRFKVYDMMLPHKAQKGGTLYRFAHSSPPFNGTWNQIALQRGAGMGDMFKDFKSGVKKSVKTAWQKKNLSELGRGIKRSAKQAAGREIRKRARKGINDIFGLQ